MVDDTATGSYNSSGTGKLTVVDTKRSEIVRGRREKIIIQN